MVKGSERVFEEVPRHVAVIMDGNGRWARARGMPRIFGHRHGVEAVRRTVRAAHDLGIAYLTLFSFSTENWRRPDEEVNELMHLLRIYLRSELAELHKSGVCLRMIGDRRQLPRDVVALVENAEALTADNKEITVVMALSYGGRQDIVNSARELAMDVAEGHLKPSEIDEAVFESRLATAQIPDPDMLVRTSGEKRISNFLLWQCAYAELVFVDTYWPDFTKQHLEDAIEEFQRRERRYGAVVGTRS